VNEITIDCVVFGYDNGCLKVILSKQNKRVGTKWGLISGMVRDVKNTDAAALTLLNEYGSFKMYF